MPTCRLTKTVVEAISPRPTDQYYWDALPRFGLRVTPAGSRIYLIQYRARSAPGQPPKTRRVTIGHHGQPWTVEQARNEAKRLLAQVDLDGDPFAQRAADRDARAAEQRQIAAQAMADTERAANSFKAVAERYLEIKVSANRSAVETKRLLRHGPIAEWGARHIGDVQRSDVGDLIDKIALRSPAIARSTFAVVRPFFAWCVERDLIERSPCEGLRAPPRPKPRERVLSDDELRRAWHGSDRLSGSFGPIVKLLILTGQRRAEVAGMTWAELDLAGAVWRLPGERTKNGRAHEVDLSPQALEVLEKVPRIGPLLFPARSHRVSRDGEGAVRGFSATKRQLNQRVVEADADSELDPSADLPMPSTWRLHDLRRTAATGMAGLGIAPHVIERILNHISGAQGGLVGVYQRHEYRPERKAAMLAWGSQVEAIVSGRPSFDNVHQLRPAK